MKNLGILYRYELKKLLKRKLAWATVLLLAAVMVYAAWPKFSDSFAVFQVTDSAGNTIRRDVTLEEQDGIKRTGDLPICGLPMGEDFFRQFRELSLFSGEYTLDGRFGVDSYFKIIDPRFSWAYYLVEGVVGEENAASVTAEEFYTRRQQKLEDMWRSKGLSERDIAYWQAMEEKVEKPFVYRNIWGARELLDMRPVFLAEVIPLAAAVFLCGMFAEDKRTRTDALIFSSRYGWFPLYLAKVLAGCTAALAASGVILGTTAAAIFLAYDITGLDAAVQLRVLDSSLPITMGQAVLMMWGLLLLYGLLCGGVAMLLSVLTKNAITAMAAPSLLMLAQMMRLPVPSWMEKYLPYWLFDVYDTLGDPRLVHIFGVPLNKIQFCFLLYGALTVLLLGLCWVGWRRSAADAVSSS